MSESRVETFLKAAMTEEKETNLPKPRSRVEELLQNMAENGVAGGDPPASGSANIDVTAEVGQTIIVKEVDGNGKPTKWKAAEYQPRTHWQGENVQGGIVPHTVFTPALYEYFGCTVYPLAPFTLEEGKSYTVVFDGVEYACVATAFAMPANYIEGIYIGNPVFSGGANNGMPFCVATFDNPLGDEPTVLSNNKHHYVLCMDTERHTVQVIGEKPVYNKIPDEYAKSDFMVEITANMANGYPVMLTPWEEIEEAVKANKNIYGAVRCVETYDFDQYGQPIYFYETARYVFVSAKIGRNGNLKSEIVFASLSNTTGMYSLMTVVRDENGVTTVKGVD